MPNVNGKKFPYTPAGMAAAKKAAKKPSKRMTPSETYSLLKKKTAKKPGSVTRPMPQRKPRPMNNRRGM